VEVRARQKTGGDALEQESFGSDNTIAGAAASAAASCITKTQMEKLKSPTTLRSLTIASIADCCKLGVLQTQTGLAPHLPAPVLEDICDQVAFSGYETWLLSCIFSSSCPYDYPFLPHQLLELQVLKRVQRSQRKRQLRITWNKIMLYGLWPKEDAVA
jgi:hypothetical protein